MAVECLVSKSPNTYDKGKATQQTDSWLNMMQKRVIDEGYEG